MNNRVYRLKNSNDFETVFKKGKRAFASNLMMIYSESKTLQAGFSVGKKHGNSVKRNYIKRRLRASFYSLAPFITKNCRFVFIPKAGEEHTYAKLRSAMKYLLKKEKIFNAEKAADVRNKNL